MRRPLSESLETNCKQGTSRGSSRAARGRTAFEAERQWGMGVGVRGAACDVFLGVVFLGLGAGVDFVRVLGGRVGRGVGGASDKSVVLPVSARCCRAIAPRSLESCGLYVRGGRVGVGGTGTNDCTSLDGSE